MENLDENERRPFGLLFLGKAKCREGEEERRREEEEEEEKKVKKMYESLGFCMKKLWILV